MFTLLRRKLTHLHRDNYCHLCNRNFKNARGLRLHKRVMHSKTTFHALIVLLITVLLGLYSSQTRAYEMISPVSTRPGEGIVATGAVDPTQAPVPSATPTPTPTAEIEASDAEIVAKIKRVFGSHADKALLLLTCENASHNPKAVNINNDKVKSRDYGVFQINDYWQGIRHTGKAKQFLMDPDINISIAWRIYEDSGYSFHLWTCGRKFGI